MINNSRILAVVPARGGSKGIPLKNIRPVCGVPLVVRVGQVLKELPIIDRAVVSTDHDQIALLAGECGIAAPFRRPPELSGDCVGDWDVLIHALYEMERIDGISYEIIVMLQPTSPLRKPAHVSAAVEMLVEENWDAVWTLSETDSKAHPLKQMTLNGSEMNYYDLDGKDIIARQQLRPVYHRNGIAYVMTRDCLVNQSTIKGRRTGGLLLEGNFVSIDDEYDLALCEFIMNNQD